MKLNLQDSWIEHFRQKKEAQSGEIMRAMKRAFDGALTPMMQFMLDSKSLTEDELGQLEAMIKNKSAKLTADKKEKVKR